MDLYPTLIELAGLAPKTDLEGESLVPLLTEPNSERVTPAISFWDYSYSIRTERWHYIQYFDGSQELYDHNEDPKEINNLADITTYQEIKDSLAQWIPSQENWLIGTPTNDSLVGNEEKNILIGDEGNDILNGKGGDDQLLGMEGNDKLYGGKGSDFLFGEDGNDLLLGNKGNDQLGGLGGNDTLKGGEGNDEIIAGAGNDILFGKKGNDFLNGRHNDDLVFGNEGNDVCRGEKGADTLYGGLGNDTLQGNKGADVFVLDSDESSLDQIDDFVASEDKILIQGLELTSPPEQFVQGDKALDGDDRIIYNSETGSLSFDPDGSSSTAQIPIAILINQAPLTADNIYLDS